MPTYHYNAPSLLDDVSFMENERGTSRAYLHAHDDVDDNQIAGIIALLRHHDFDCVPYTDEEGRAVLEVRNFGRPKKLLKTLKGEHIVTGTPAIQQRDGEAATIKEKLSKRTLQLSGIFQVLGDMMFYRYNRLEGHVEGDMSSYFYMLGTASVLGYGKNDQSEIQVRDLAQAFEKVLEKKNIQIPDDSALHSIAHEKEKNPLLKIHEFMKRYPSEAYNVTTGLAGAMVALNAYKNHYTKAYPAAMSAASIAAHRSEGLRDIGLGLTTFLGCLYGLVVKEKKADPDEPQPKDTIGKVIQYIQHNPLSVTGTSLMVSSAVHAVSTVGAYREAVRVNDAKRKKSVPWRGGFVLTNFMGEVLIAVSSKGHGEGVTTDDTVHDTAYKMAAEVILSQPEDKREYLTNYIADFLEQPDVLAEKRETVMKKLQDEISKLKDNPWLCCHPELTKPGEHVLLEDPPTRKKAKEWSQKMRTAPNIDEYTQIS